MKGAGRSVLQDWVHQLTFMQQSVLITSCRGPDGLHKDHVAKALLRWLRRCFLISAFDKKVLEDPRQPGGGSFTGPIPARFESLDDMVDEYLKSCDEVPHHFHLHLMHSAEILGYKHPTPWIREWWRIVYYRMANDMHLVPETEEKMERRLGDNEAGWRKAEEVTAL